VPDSFTFLDFTIFKVAVTRALHLSPILSHTNNINNQDEKELCDMQHKSKTLIWLFQQNSVMHRYLHDITHNERIKLRRFTHKSDINIYILQLWLQTEGSEMTRSFIK
jgi:hypothetical protein